MLASLPRSSWLVLAALLLVAWFSGIAVRKLQHPDEGRYAEIAREMAVTGNWVTPRLNGLKYFEKPPLQYWATAATFNAFGVHEWTARLVPALAGVFTVVMIGVTMARLDGATSGAYGALAMAGSLWPFAMSQLLTLDSVLCAWLTAMLCAFLLAQRDRLSLRGRRNLMLIAYAAAAGATLTKGLVALVIPGGALVLYSLATRDIGPWKRLHILPGLALYMALAAPWFLLVSRVNPEFAQFFFIHEHVERFLTNEHRREGSWYYFIPLLAAGILPWLTVWLWTLKSSWRNAPVAANGFSWPRFCLAWAAFVFVFFSVSGSKLPSYILPMFPALALVLGWQIKLLPFRTLARLVLPLAILSVLLLVGVAVAVRVYIPDLSEPGNPAEVFHAFAPWLVAAVSIMTTGAVAAYLLLRRETSAAKTLAVATLALGTVAGVQVGFIGYDAFRMTRSAYDLVREAAGSIDVARGDPFDPKVPVFQVRTYDQTLPFYLGRTTTLVAYRDEMALGLDVEPGHDFATEAAWIPAWTALTQGYALIKHDDYAALAAQSVPMRVVARDPRRVFVARQ
ncbi:MAG TPA: glycosyltransferase family 39 protein [Casimicrobiaceae bacterium]|nr:glycosyltransferase family 39 protein [Casimicrobiaceae bacterium]